MKVHNAKLLNVIQYTGKEPRLVRELLVNPLPMVNPGDLLIVPEKVAKFLSRAGSPFEMFSLEEFIENGDTDFSDQISDDAVAKVTQLNTTILELEEELKIKADELESYELRENQEMEELKALNESLNEQLSSLPIIDTVTAPKKTATLKTTTTAKEETL